MTFSRKDVPWRVALAVGHPVRWAPPERAAGDYDGRERTLEIFMADAREQLELLRSLRAVRTEIEAAAGGPIVLMFHTVAETTRLYPEMLNTSILRGVRVEAQGHDYVVRIDEAVGVQHGSLTLDWDGVAA